MATRTSTASGGNASAGGSWVGGVAPVDGDSIVVVAGATITQDVNRIYGSKTGAAAHAVNVKASSSVSFGTFTVNSGVTVTLRGFDQDYTATGNTCLCIEQWARFTPSAGSTILLDVATDGQSHVFNHGVIGSIGTDITGSGTRVLWDVPAANKNWNNAHSYDTGSIAYLPYDKDRNLGCLPLNAHCISNAAGTGLGALGDSSLSFGSQTPAGILATEVASIALVNGVGKYYVDYAGGLVWFYTTQANGSTSRFVATAKKLTWLGASILSTDATDGNQAIFRHSLIGCLGSNAASLLAIVGDGKVKTGTLRDFEVTHCLFQYGRGVQMRGVTGASGNPIKVEDNEFIGQADFEGYGAQIGFANASTAYVSVARSKSRPNYAPFITSYNVPSHDHASIRDNVALTPTFAIGDAATTGTTWPDLDASGNAMLAIGSLYDSRQWGVFNGTSGHPSVTQGNLFWRAMRAVSYGAYQSILDNVLGHNYHHTIHSSYQLDDVWFPGLTVTGNISTRAENGGAFCDFGYNRRVFTDGAIVARNTIYRNTGWAALSFGDQYDDAGSQLAVGILMSSNLVVQALNAVRRVADSATCVTRSHFAGDDYNGIYGSTGADFTGGAFARFSTFAGITNVAGVSLSNPSFSTPASGKSLALVVTSETNKTLAWDGGTAVQLIQDSGTCSGASTSGTYPSRSFLNDTSKAWSTAMNNAACPAGRWVKVTGGTGAGQIRRITNNTATQLTVVPALTTPLDATSTYVIVKAEVTLSNSGATQSVVAGIDFRTLPTTSQTDAAIAVSFHGVTANPSMVDPERDVAKWDLSLGGAGTEDSAYARLFADPTLTRSSLIPYLRAGFVPTNAAYDNTGYDGGDIGAMDYTPPAVSTHLAFATQPGGAALGALLSPQPVVQRLNDSDNTLSSDTTSITVALVTVSGGPGVLNGTTTKTGPTYTGTDLYVTGSPGVYELSAT